MRRWLFVVVAVLVVGLAGVVTVHVVRRARWGDVRDETRITVAIDRGGRFTLAVPDRGASVGDHWTASVRPEGAAVLVRSELVAGNVFDRVLGPANGGGGGTRYFVFDARRAGSAAITLHNCFQACADDRTRAASRDLTWTVKVH
jgi:inhibitor of cysteine peptidase